MMGQWSMKNVPEGGTGFNSGKNFGSIEHAQNLRNRTVELF
jgi:hypothetical protein